MKLLAFLVRALALRSLDLLRLHLGLHHLLGLHLLGLHHLLRLYLGGLLGLYLGLLRQLDRGLALRGLFSSFFFTSTSFLTSTPFFLAKEPVALRLGRLQDEFCVLRHVRCQTSS